MKSNTNWISAHTNSIMRGLIELERGSLESVRALIQLKRTIILFDLLQASSEWVHGWMDKCAV